MLFKFFEVTGTIVTGRNTSYKRFAIGLFKMICKKIFPVVAIEYEKKNYIVMDPIITYEF